MAKTARDEEDDLARKFGSGLIEAINRAEATALLIRGGNRVYRPEADFNGEDLLVWHKASRAYIRVQLKSRLRVSKARYGGPERAIWMLFPSGPIRMKKPRQWYLVPHDCLYAELLRLHGHAPKWRDNWSDRFVSEDMKGFLERWLLGTIEITEHPAVDRPQRAPKPSS